MSDDATPDGTDEPEPEHDLEPAPEIEGDDTDEPETTDEPEPEPEGDEMPDDVAGGPSEAQMEAAFKAVDRRAASWVKFVGETAGDLGQPVVQCPCCLEQVPGFLFDPSVVPLSADQLAGARVLLGMNDQPTYAQAPDDAECPRCGGWGKLRTGSKVAAMMVVTCRECSGRGFTGPSANVLPAEVPGLAAVPEGVEAVPADESPDADAWGTPREHPDWGKAPQYRALGWADDLARFKLGLAPEAPLPLPVAVV